jgi:glyoxylase-like metal-dependent hydrolase (beta-lactamase superfamily II)
VEPESYKFGLGTFECVAIKDAVHTYENPATLLFLNAPKDHLAQVLREHKIELARWYEWISPYTPLFIETESHKVLVDTGIGSTFPPAEGRLIQQLERLEVRPDEIDIVLITHAHGDHCGCNTDSEGQAAFPQARYIMWKKEWDFWTSEGVLAEPQHEWMAPVVDKNLWPLHDRFELIEEDTEVVPGVEAIDASGHTPGHMIVRISSGGEQLWYMSDAFLHPLHIRYPDWYAEVDVQPEQAVITRKSLLDQVGGGQPLIHCFHFPFPGLGHIHENEQGYCWRPIESALNITRFADSDGVE